MDGHKPECGHVSFNEPCICGHIATVERRVLEAVKNKIKSMDLYSHYEIECSPLDPENFPAHLECDIVDDIIDTVDSMKGRWISADINHIEEETGKEEDQDSPRHEHWMTANVECFECSDPIAIRLGLGRAVIDGVPKEVWLPEMADAYAHRWSHE